MGCLISRDKETDSDMPGRQVSLMEPGGGCNGMSSTEFTEDQKQLVKATWDVVREDISKVGVITFLRSVFNSFQFLIKSLTSFNSTLDLNFLS